LHQPAPARGGVVLARCGHFEVRLTEFSPDMCLWIELFRDGGRELVDGCGFSEIEDAVDAVRELVEKARRLHDGTGSTSAMLDVVALNRDEHRALSLKLRARPALVPPGL
jgi:hypothetical protein